MDEICLGPNVPQGRDDLRVLVRLPPPQPQLLDPRAYEVQELLLRHALMDAPPLLPAPNELFKQQLIDTYHCKIETTKTTATASKSKKKTAKSYSDKLLRCMLLNTPLPSALVVPVHLFRRCNQFMVEAF